MQALLDITPPKYSLISLRNYYDRIETYVRGLESIGQTTDYDGSLLVPIILNKLPGDVRKNIAREHGSTDLELDELRQGLFHELNIMEAGNATEYTDNLTATAAFHTNAKIRSKFSNRQASSAYKKSCAFCHESHSAVNCTKFEDPKARMTIVKRDRLCFNCLGHHSIADCKSHQSCRKCKKRHHTSLCKDKDQQERDSKINVNTIQVSNSNQGNDNDNDARSANDTDAILHSQAPANVLLKTAVAQVSSGYVCTEANILFDEGAQRSFITEKLAEELNLQVNGRENVNLSGFGDKPENTRVRSLKTANVYILTDDGKIPINVLIIPEIAVPLKTYVHKTTHLKYLSGLRLAHPSSHEPTFEVELLIGADNYWSIVEDQVIRGAGPTAVKSKICYLLSGPITGSAMKSDTCTSMMNILVSHKIEELNLEMFWEVESAGIENSSSKSTNYTFQQEYEKNCISYHDNRYVAKLPWKENHPTLLDNRNIAKGRTINVINRLRRQPMMLQKYGQIIDEQEKRGFIEKVTNEVKESTKVHYIPHHYVRKESSTTPLRIVFDCSCKPARGSPSLNECLKNVSPNLNELTGILLRFRLHKYAVATDIEKAFLNIGLDIDDRDATRFYWLSNPVDPESELITYRFKSVLFGATCSPFILHAVLSKHLKDNPNDWSEILEKDLYVDNIISSFRQEESLLQYFHTSRFLFSKAGFNLRAWASNSKKLQRRATEENVNETDKLVKILG